MGAFITVSKDTKIKIYDLVITDYELQFRELKKNKPKLNKHYTQRTEEEKKQAKEYRHHYQRLCNNINSLLKQKQKLIKGK